MDPEANTNELKTIIADMNQTPNSHEDWHHDAQRAWDLTDALQQWMQNQGFKPKKAVSIKTQMSPSRISSGQLWIVPTSHQVQRSGHLFTVSHLIEQDCPSI